jgi:chromosome segregation ATPase
MEPTDLTIEILKGIREDTREMRDGLRQTNEALKQTNVELRKTHEEVRQTNVRLDALRGDMGRRMTELEVRVATELVGVAGAVREVRDMLRDDLRLRDRVEDHERRIAAMERRPA